MDDYILLLVDEYSRYYVSQNLTVLQPSQRPYSPLFKAINALKTIFKIYGTTEEIKSDNGPVFKSKIFRAFTNLAGFKHIKITPMYPEANPTCERFMANIKKQIRIARITGANWRVELERFIGDYRCTPHSTTKLTPNELFEIDDTHI